MLSKYGVELQGGETPLHWAARRGEEKVVVVLLQAGADKDSKTEVFSTRRAVCIGYALPRVQLNIYWIGSGKLLYISLR